MPWLAKRSCRLGWRWAGSIATSGLPKWWRGQRGTCWSLRRGFRAAHCSDRSCPRSAGVSSWPERKKWWPDLCWPLGSLHQIFYEVPPFELSCSKREITCCLIHVFVCLSLNTGYLQCVKCAMATSARTINPRSKKKERKKNKCQLSASKALVLPVYLKKIHCSPSYLAWHQEVAACGCALCSDSALTGVLLTSGAKYEEPSHHSQLLVGSKGWRRKCERVWGRDARRGGGVGREGGGGVTQDCVCVERERERERETGGQFDSHAQLIWSLQSVGDLIYTLINWMNNSFIYSFTVSVFTL